MKWCLTITISTTRSSRAVVRVNQVNEAVNSNKCHSTAVRKFSTESIFSSVKRFGLFANYSVLIHLFPIDLDVIDLDLCLVDKLLTITDLDPIRRYLAPCDRPKPNSRYSSIQVSISRRVWLDFREVQSRIHHGINTLRAFLARSWIKRFKWKSNQITRWSLMWVISRLTPKGRRSVDDFIRTRFLIWSFKSWRYPNRFDCNRC